MNFFHIIVALMFLTSFVTLSSTNFLVDTVECDGNDDKSEIDIYEDKVLSRQKRNFGGTEPINFQLVYNSTFGVKGWLASGIEGLQDITFHLTGYTIIACFYNFGEAKKNPDKVRQKYLDAFFGPSPIAVSGLRALRNPLFQFTFRFWYDLLRHTDEMTESMRNTTVRVITNTLLSEAYLHTKIFRDVCTIYFVMIGWSTYYIVNRWNKNAPIIAGKRKKRSNKDLTVKNIEEILNETYLKIVTEMESKSNSRNKNEEDKDEGKRIFLKTINNGQQNMEGFCTGNNSCPPTEVGVPRAYGDYQYYLSFGGDQILDLPASIDNVFGSSVFGVYPQFGHVLSQPFFEAAGYTAMGFMYNGVYRTMIEDNESRKFIDTFLGPSVVVSHAMRIFRNGYFSLATRLTMLFFLPLTRYEIIELLQNISVTQLKKTVFADGYLHNRIVRHLIETGLSLVGTSTFYLVYRYKKANLDPKPEKKDEKTTEKAPVGGKGSSTTKKPTLLKKYYSQSESGEALQNYNKNYGYNYNKFISDDESDIYQDSKYNNPERFQDHYLNNPTYHFED